MKWNSAGVALAVVMWVIAGWLLWDHLERARNLSEAELHRRCFYALQSHREPDEILDMVESIVFGQRNVKGIRRSDDDVIVRYVSGACRMYSVKPLWDGVKRR